jgi:hypothetical protein
VLGSETKGFYCPPFPFSHFKLTHSDINNGSGMFNFRYYSVMKTLSHIPVAFGKQWKRGSYINLLMNKFPNTHAEILWRCTAFIPTVEEQGSQL